MCVLLLQYVLFAPILSQFLTFRDDHHVCGRQNFASELEADDIQFSTDTSDLIKIGVHLHLGNYKPCKVIL